MNTPCFRAVWTKWVLVVLLVGIWAGRAVFAAPPSRLRAAAALIQRIVPRQAHWFVLEPLAAETGKDVFEIESRNKKIVLRGNNGVAIASALYHYLTEYCHCQLTWNGTQLKLPVWPPMPVQKIHRNTPYHYRYYLNYCTFNYSMSWWNWERWEREIDWMALHGINLPLAITGEEYTWHALYRQMGFTEAELTGFFSGPAYFSWFWMGNLDGWGGPLPVSWMNSHRNLQQRILQRERALGMQPVLPAFTGHVPAAFQQKFPRAKLKQTNWNNGFGDTYLLDPGDPLFAEIGRRFLQLQTRLYGTNHLYSADTFNENEPPSNDPAFLSALSAKLYAAMRSADTAAIWVMQGWLFYSDRKFWKAPQVEALLKAVPDSNLLLLDLAAEIEPVWKSTAAFYGKPWIWNMLNNFGGNINLFGRMEGVAAGPALALHDPAAGRMAGIGLTMEAIEQNPVMYELLLQHTWQQQPVELDQWLPAYVRNRYGSAPIEALKAWQVLRRTVYNGRLIRDGAESILTGRPTLDEATVWTRTQLNYAAKDLLPAWKGLVQCISTCRSSDGFRFDLVDVTRQVLANYALPLQRRWVKAYRAKDRTAFDTLSLQYLELISDLDTLLATREDFLLGRWLAAARQWGNTPSEKALYERNARNLVTLWGNRNSPLHEYANRQWSGLLNDFYRPRWQQFFTVLSAALPAGPPPDLPAFENQIRDWEWRWVNQQQAFPVHPRGDAATIAVRLYQKYYPHLLAAYP